LVLHFSAELVGHNWQRMCDPPKDSGGGSWINPNVVPPDGFIAAAMHLAVMSAAKRDRKLVADLAAECQ
jgi:hypothetical protein